MEHKQNEKLELTKIPENNLFSLENKFFRCSGHLYRESTITRIDFRI